MSQITWKNISAPNFSGALAGYSAGIQTLNKAANTVDRLLQTGAQKAQNRWDDQKQTNTDDEVASLQQVNNLKDFYAQEDNYNLESVRDRHGMQADYGTIQGARSTLLNKLNQQAVAAATAEGRAVAESTGSASEAAKAFRSALESQGVQDAKLLQSAPSDFLSNSLATFKAGQAEELATNDKKLYQAIDSLGDVRKMSNADAMSAIERTLGSDNYSPDAAVALLKDTRNTQMHNSRNAAGTAAFNTLAQTGSIQDFQQVLAKADIPQTDKEALLQQGITYQKNLLSSPEAQATLGAGKNYIGTSVATYEKIASNKAAALTATKQNMVFSDSMLDQAETISQKNPQGIISELIQNDDSSWANIAGHLKGASVSTLKQTFGEARTHITKDLGLSTKEADAVLLKSWQDLGGRSKNEDANATLSAADLKQQISANAAQLLNEKEDKMTINMELGNLQKDVLRMQGYGRMALQEHTRSAIRNLSQGKQIPVLRDSNIDSMIARAQEVTEVPTVPAEKRTSSEIYDTLFKGVKPVSQQDKLSSKAQPAWQLTMFPRSK